MRLQHISLMSCNLLLLNPSQKPLDSFLNVLFSSGMQIVQPPFEKSVLPFLAFDLHCLEAFWQGRDHVHYTLKIAWRESWKSYVSLITVGTLLTEVFYRIHKISGRDSAHPPPVLSYDRGTVADPKALAELFAEHFWSGCRKDLHLWHFIVDICNLLAHFCHRWWRVL